MKLFIIIAIASAIAVNVLVWINELRKLKFFTFLLDAFSTFFIVKFAGGGSYIMAAALFSSLIVSYYINRVIHIPDIPDIFRIKKFKDKKKRRKQ